MTQHFEKVQTATLDWQQVDGVDIPVSKQFGDVYFSKANGLLETRHVFLNGNDLSTRLAELKGQQYFTVGETGFGTGLNFLALWQLWQQVRPDNKSHLHFISVEKYPLSLADLNRTLVAWQELIPLSEQLIAQYPLPLAGCHRLFFPNERISLDLWLGDAAECFPQIQTKHPINAWFLDGFAPSCNPELWTESVFSHIMRLSGLGTSFASFSVAGVLKRTLAAYGVTISRPKGFGYKREMLKGVWQNPTATQSENTPQIHPISNPTTALSQHEQEYAIAIIGAGIAGLNCAWALAKRGIKVTLFEKTQPLSGGSGNPLALLNPKLCPIEQSATHLMTTSWQYALRFYQQFEAFRALKVFQLHEKDLQHAKDLCEEYPDDILSWQKSQSSTLESSLLHYAGALAPHQFAAQVLAHPLIDLHIAEITDINKKDDAYILSSNQQQYHATHVIACNALALNTLFPQTTKLKPIRGQVSWAKVQHPFNNQHIHTGYSYGGYAMPLDQQHLVFGASFLPNNDTTEVTLEDHQHNFDLMQHTLAQFADQLPTIQEWQGRASLRAQTADYLPLVGKIHTELENVYYLAGLGSKGFLFAPLCSEIIVSQILGQALPVPQDLAHLLRPNRFRKK